MKTMYFAEKIRSNLICLNFCISKSIQNVYCTDLKFVNFKIFCIENLYTAMQI